jgi:tight adherence protein B
MNTTAIVLCGMMSVIALGRFVAEAFLGHDRRIRHRIRDAIQSKTPGAAGKSSLFRDWAASQEGSDGLIGRWKQAVEQSGLPITIEQAADFSAAAGILGTLAGYIPSSSFLAAAATGVVALSIPWIVVLIQRKRRIDKFSEQLPEVLDVMSRAVAAGQSVPAALQMVGAECPAPISKEFALCCEQQNLGLPQDTTLRDLARRVPVPELHLLVVALLVQRQCGGSPVEVLSSISDLTRKRIKLSNRVQALTGEGRMQALVLTVLPIAAFIWLWLSQRDYIQVLLDRPWVLLSLIGLQLLGTAWIRRTIQIEY